MELRQLRYFLAVAEDENISAAARKLNLSQPALSRQIKALEEELGWVLLERGKKSVGLTSAGAVVAAEGRKILERVELGLERMKREIDGVVLRVGYAPSLSSEILGRALECFSQVHPQVRVELLDANSVEMEEGMAQGTLDVVVGGGSHLVDGIRWVPLREHGWLVAMGSNHKLAARELITSVDLDGERLLLYCKTDYPAYWDEVTRFFKANKIDAKVAGEFDGITSMTAAIEGGLGVALVAEMTRFGATSRTVTRPLDPQPGKLVVAAGLPEKVEPSKWALAFVEELKQAAGSE
jgi:DNA-binding transcriptional LysR family regulator